MARKIGKNHYIASPLKGSGYHSPLPIPVHVTRSSAYSDEEDSHQALSERTLSEYTSVPYTIVSERDGNEKSTHYPSNPYRTCPNNRAALTLSKSSRYEDNSEDYDDNRCGGFDDNGSDIYVTSGAYREYNIKAPSEVSRSSKPRAPSRYSYRSEVAPSIASRASRTSTIKTEKSSRKRYVTD